MKRKRRLFGILLMITALIIMQLPVAEADAATSASDFKMEGNKLVKYRGTEKNVSVPDTVEVIGEDAFAGNTEIELVVLPNSVKKIEAYAFWGCEKLDNVVLGKGLTEVGDYVFTNCKGLKKISIPSNIRSIGIKAFADCVNLTDITIAPEVTGIHETAFDGCYKLLIHCEAGTVADQYATSFYERQKEMPEYEDVSDYPENVDSDDDRDQNKQDTTEPESPAEIPGTTIGATQVVGNQAVVFVDNTSLQVLSGKEGMTKPEVISQENVSEIESGIPKYTIVDNTVVADQAYYRNQQLQKVVLPESIQEAGQFAFARSSVTEITLPEGAGTIGYGAFYHCDELRLVVLPETIENVEPKAFDYTAWIRDFQENGTEDFLVSGNVLVAYRGNAGQVVVPEGVRVIAGEVFADHQEIETVTLPESAVVIGEAAFSNCNHLKNVYFGNQVKQIKDRAFFGCSLSSVELPEVVEEVGTKAFDETVQVEYAEGKVPVISHELSAERLSNEAYRDCKEEQSAKGVTVSGVEAATAHLEGAVRSYTLFIRELTDKSAMEKAFIRNLQSLIPDDMVLYELQLTDNSDIPITKLGKQSLEIVMPVPDSLISQNLTLYTLDRNGQLEQVPAERVKLDGEDCLRFRLNFLSCIGIAGNGTAFDDDYVSEETTSIISMSAVQSKATSSPIQWGIGSVMLIVGFLCIFWKKQSNE